MVITSVSAASPALPPFAREMVIAAKNGVKEETVGEICDLLYHTLVMMVDQGISIEDVEAVLQKRAEKAGNLKKFHKVDKNS